MGYKSLCGGVKTAVLCFLSIWVFALAKSAILCYNFDNGENRKRGTTEEYRCTELS
jgi:hypothetical protein